MNLYLIEGPARLWSLASELVEAKMFRELYAENRQFKRFARHLTCVGIISDLLANGSHGRTVEFGRIARSGQ
jgi:hypothetical protein